MTELLYRDLTCTIMGAARNIYEGSGPDYWESVYEDALCDGVNGLKGIKEDS